MLTLLTPLALIGCGESINLSQLSAAEGDEIETQTSVLIEGEIAFYLTDNERTDGTFEMQSEHVIEKEIQKVDDGLATEWIKKIEEDESVFIFDINGDREKNRESSPLLGEEIRVRVRNGRIRASLLEGEPTPEQDAELDYYGGVPDYDHYPKDPVKPGDEWEMDEGLMASMTSMDGIDLDDAAGTSKYLKNEEIDGVLCAVIESKLDLEGKYEVDDNMPPADIELEMTMTKYLSLDKGVALKGEGRGTIKMAFDMGGEMRMVMDGDLEIEIDSEIK